MKENIRTHLDQPAVLEALYREHPGAFTSAFDALYPEVYLHPVAQAWQERLHFKPSQAGTTTREWLYLSLACFLAGLIAKFPDFLSLEGEWYYPRNAGFIFIPVLTFFVAWKNRISSKTLAVIAVIFAAAALYLNLYPADSESDTLILAGIHLPLFLWMVFGFVFSGGKAGDVTQRMRFLQFNGEFLVLSAILMLSGGILTGITLGLFNLIDLNIEDVYMRWAGVWGASSVPVVATFLIQRNPGLVSAISPTVARIFSPLALLVLTGFFSAMLYTGKDPYNDREFLLLFNLLLLGVMALIVFSVSEVSRWNRPAGWLYLLAGLAGMALLLDLIAVSAIIFRISEWGFTPNRTAVLGSNLLIMSHLAMVLFRLLGNLFGNDSTRDLERTLVQFLPVYAVWSLQVAVVFPLIFGFH